MTTKLRWLIGIGLSINTLAAAAHEINGQPFEVSPSTMIIEDGNQLLFINPAVKVGNGSIAVASYSSFGFCRRLGFEYLASTPQPGSLDPHPMGTTLMLEFDGAFMGIESYVIAQSITCKRR